MHVFQFCNNKNCRCLILQILFIKKSLTATLPYKKNRNINKFLSHPINVSGQAGVNLHEEHAQVVVVRVAAQQPAQSVTKRVDV